MLIPTPETAAALVMMAGTQTGIELGEGSPSRRKSPVELANPRRIKARRSGLRTRAYGR